MNVVIFDAETFYDPEQGYTLSKMSTSEYICDPRFRLLGFGIKVNDKPAKYFHGDDALRAMKPYLEDAVVVCHNAQFDCFILSHHYGIKPKMIACTLSMARGLGLQAEVGGSLAKLSAHFGLGEKAPLTPNSTPEELALRGAQDCELTYGLFKILAPRMPKSELKLIDLTIRQFTEPMIEADVEALTDYATMLDAQKEQLLVKLGVDETELASTALFASRLEHLGVEVPLKLSPSGNWIPAVAKTDQGMKDLLEHDDPTIAALAAARLNVKSTGNATRARTFIRMAQHGPLPVYYNYYGAHSGRPSGGDGTNFTNLGRGGVIRDCLLAPEGYSFVVGDLSQIEARITALLAGQLDLVEAFREGRDTYCEFGTYLFRKPVTKAEKFERFVAKFWILGGGYGMGAKKGAAQTKAEIYKYKFDFTPPTVEQCQVYVDAYRGRYAEIPKMWKRAELLIEGPDRVLGPVVSEAGAILLPNGMRLLYPNLRYERFKTKQMEDKQGWRYDSRKGQRTPLYGGKITENVVQALARIIHTDAMVRLSRNFKCVLQTYDDIGMIVPTKDADRAAKAMEFEMTQPPKWMPDLPLAVEIGIGSSFGACK